MNQPELILTPTDFVAIANQTLEYTFGLVKIEGELANFRISKKRWVYFDIKDELSKIACFASIYNLPGPLEDGMLVVIDGQPRLHPQFGFSITIQTVKPSGEGSIKKAYEILQAKLQAEGLFEPARKRFLPYPPQSIALITSKESAAYTDFIKVLNNRWPFVELKLYDVQVQGEASPLQLTEAINTINNLAELPDVMVITRGGGSADDLVAFDDERVVRAIASSRVATMVAIGHETDVSLSELAADKRASTPSNAAELLVPSKKDELANLSLVKTAFQQNIRALLKSEITLLNTLRRQFLAQLANLLEVTTQQIKSSKALLRAYSPDLALKRGYSIARLGGAIVKSIKQVKVNNKLTLTLSDGGLDANIQAVYTKREQKL
jgi:exodeoxyribonuclease VII large subunit